MSKNRRRVLAVLAVSALLAGPTASAAHAGAARSWWSVCAAYSGKSWYSTSGMGYAITTVSDNDQVGAAVRYYGGSTKFTRGYGYAERSRAAAPTGGYHQSYCGMTVTVSSNV